MLPTKALKDKTPYEIWNVKFDDNAIWTSNNIEAELLLTTKVNKILNSMLKPFMNQLEIQHLSKM